jgi:pyruvate/2-oxoglutarate dehydrogenase complex dihydrolipoamide dehydrogenase (E3) component
VGLYPSDFAARNIKFDTYERKLDDVDRAILEDDTDGYVRIYTKKGGDQILGATIVGADAGNMISEVSVAM